MRIIIYLFVLTDTTFLTTGLYNAARYKPAVQSSTWSDLVAYLGVDGNGDDNVQHGHCQHTQQENMPWWMVDLRGQFVVDAIRLTNRGDMGPKVLRLHNFQIDIFQQDPRNLANFPNITGDVCYNQTAPLGIGTYNFTCLAPVTGRFVRLVMKIDYKEYLHICEMEVLVSDNMFTEFFFIAHEDTRLSATVLGALTVGDPFSCAQECLALRTSTCTGFNWVTTSKICQLYSVNPNSDLTSYLKSAQGTHFYIQSNFL